MQRVLDAAATEDYHTLFGVSSKDSAAAVKQAYKRLCLQVHPDKNNAPRAKEAFTALGVALEVLTDPARRRLIPERSRTDCEGAEGPLVPTRSTSQVQLPRFGLTFDVREVRGAASARQAGVHRVLESKDFKGYRLAPVQQLQHTLTELKQYLILENSEGDLKVIVPDGRVSHNSETGQPTIAIPSRGQEDCDRRIKWYYSRLSSPTQEILSANRVKMLHFRVIYLRR